MKKFLLKWWIMIAAIVVVIAATIFVLIKTGVVDASALTSKVISGSLSPTTLNVSDGSKVTYTYTTTNSYRIYATLYTGKGKYLKTIYDSKDLVPAGTYSNVVWDGTDANGAKVSSGSYKIYVAARNEKNRNVKVINSLVTVANGNGPIPTSSVSVTPTPSSTVSVEPGAYYGPGFNSQSLANLQIGHYANTAVDYRFKSTHSGIASNVLIFIKNDMGRCTQADYNALKCYSHGNGGQMLVQLVKDDGTSSHLPSTASDAVITKSLVTELMSSHWITFKFDQQAALTSGTIYHLVFTNPSPTYNTDFVSIDDLGADNLTPVQPIYADSDMAVLYKSGSTGYVIKRNHTPIFSVNFTDGASTGIGYIDIPSSGHLTISGSTKARENFTVSGGNRTVSELNVRAAGKGTMTMTLEDGSGNVIETGTATGTSSNFAWLKLPFKSAHTLTNGSTYHVVFVATSGSFTLYSVQQGTNLSTPTGTVSFGKDTYFADGTAQKTTGSGWSDVAASYDWQFYLK